MLWSHLCVHSCAHGLEKLTIVKSEVVGEHDVEELYNVLQT